MIRNIIDPIDPQVVENELHQARFLRDSNKGNTQIYVVDGRKSPM